MTKITYPNYTNLLDLINEYGINLEDYNIQLLQLKYLLKDIEKYRTLITRAIKIGLTPKDFTYKNINKGSNNPYNFLRFLEMIEIKIKWKELDAKN